MGSKAAKTIEKRLPPFVRVTFRRWLKVYKSGAALFWQFTDLFIRIAIAQTFLRSGIVKLTNWDTALLLATNEYPVSWMAPETAAVVGVSIEVLGPILLAIGLLTRPAALAMGALMVVSQAVYVPTTTNLFLIALLGWYTFHGPASLSLDRLLGPGLRRSAVLFSRPLVLLGEYLRDHLAPIWMMAIRLWLAVTLLAAAGTFEPPIELATWLPITSMAGIPELWAILLAFPLVLGFATSIVALLLLLTGGAMAISGSHPDISLYPVLVLALYDAKGPGLLSLDNAIEKWLQSNVLFDRDFRDIPDDWPHVVVVGAGFGGLAAVNRLKKLPVRITLVDKRNYHLFQPLLYQIATATLNPSDIAVPIRSMFKEDGNVRVVKGAVQAIDTDGQSIVYGEGHKLEYDRLVLATGASHSYFGKDEWSVFAPGLKTVEDGVAVRSSILQAFETAEAIDDEDRIRRLLNFVIVGGGPTGVELAGAIAELAKLSVEREFRTFDPATARVVLVQSGERILPAFPEELSRDARKSLEDLGVEVLTGSRVTQIVKDKVIIGEDTVIETETVLWAAGVVASPAAQWLGCETDRSGRAVVDYHLRPGGHSNIYVIGDTASSKAWGGKPVPGLAPAAKQAGAHIAKVVEAELLDKPEPKPFAYRHKGSLATIGRKSAVADFGRFRLSGSTAWWLWGVVHVGFLSGARNRLSVVINWLWSFFAQQSGVRLITDAKKVS